MANKTIIKRSKDISMRTNELMRIFRASENLTETVEDILEQRAMYSSEFLRGIDASLRETKQGNVRKIVSLVPLQVKSAYAK